MENTDIKRIKAVFAANFRALRLNKKMTQAEVSEVLNCSQQTINVWENQQMEEKDFNFPKTTALLRISEYFDVSIDWLFGKEQPIKIIYETPAEYVPIIEAYKKLNTAGKERALQCVVDFTKIGEYTEKEKPISA